MIQMRRIERKASETMVWVDLKRSIMQLISMKDDTRRLASDIPARPPS